MQSKATDLCLLTPLNTIGGSSFPFIFNWKNWLYKLNHKLWSHPLQAFQLGKKTWKYVNAVFKHKETHVTNKTN